MIPTAGKPLYCDINIILDAVEQFILCDDGQKALWLLDNLPAYYQDNIPARAYELRKTYYSKLWSMADYLNDKFDNEWNDKAALIHYKDPNQWRGQYVKSLVDIHNKQNAPVHITEVGPANYWLPIGLLHDQCKFKYQSLGPNVYSARVAREYFSQEWCEEITTSSIFVCMETIEHCFNAQDIFHYYCKMNREAEYIVLSVPRYTIGNGVPDWRSRGIGHVKSWGFDEFKRWAEKTFCMHSFRGVDQYHLLLVGILKKLENAETKFTDIFGELK